MIWHMKRMLSCIVFFIFHFSYHISQHYVRMHMPSTNKNCISTEIKKVVIICYRMITRKRLTFITHHNYEIVFELSKFFKLQFFYGICSPLNYLLMLLVLDQIIFLQLIDRFASSREPFPICTCHLLSLWDNSYWFRGFLIVPHLLRHKSTVFRTYLKNPFRNVWWKHFPQYVSST